MAFPHYTQHDSMDCGATCLKMVAKYYGRFYSLEQLRQLANMGKDGVSLMDICDAAEKIGLQPLAVKISFDQLWQEVPLPCIVHYQQNHFVVVYKATAKKVWIADPATSNYTLSANEFLQKWAHHTEQQLPVGVALLLEPTAAFYAPAEDDADGALHPWRYLFQYVRRYTSLLWQLLLGVLLTIGLQFVMPFLMQAVIDIGISTANLQLVYIVLIALFVLQLSSLSVELLRNWILLHLGARININLVADFLGKLMQMPMRYFDSKFTGDLMQRIFDNERVEKFLTASSLQTLFATLHIMVFGLVLLYFDTRIFLLFALATVLQVAWIFLFLAKRKQLDNRRFHELADNQSRLIEIINGMQDIKLHQAQRQKKWAWESVQAKLFKVSVQYQQLEQWQQVGATFITETKNLLITFISAQAVIKGNMSLGTMLAIQYVVGQLHAPFEYITNFIKAAQDAFLSMQRMQEIHQTPPPPTLASVELPSLPADKTLHIQQLSFQYGGAASPQVLRDIDFSIPEGKVTAIVGTSGSGKTTLLKLLLKYYAPTHGQITVGDIGINAIEDAAWHRSCGIVLQEGFIFSDTIAHNIALGATAIDKMQLLYAAKMANIQTFIDTLPLGYNTKIGAQGLGLSQGQRQRLLIARAIYKNPHYLFFDEATNALDALNEQLIMENLQKVFENKTVVIVAHRLSTVRDADQIVVIERGEMIEKGTHAQLIQQKGAYYYLVKNQLELGV